MSLFSLVYVSSATRLMTPAELRELLTVSRTNNAAAGISGMLLYKSGNFIQVLEGSKSAVESTFAKISRDTRHRGCLVLLRAQQEQRDFEEWSMGFYDMDSEQTRSLLGYHEFMNVDLSNHKSFFDDPTRAQKLLLSFKRYTK